MKQIIIDLMNAMIPLGGAFLILVFPQWFTKRDLTSEDNQRLARTFKKAGWILLVAGTLILIANISATISAK